MVAKILSDPEASTNDKGVAMAFLRNAEIAANFELPVCQDTGTATIVAKKGQQVWTGGKDEEHLAKGVYKTYTEENLRYSQTVALDMYKEKNTGTNLPAQIDILATDGDAYKFLFIAKGGGSANKTMLYQETKALLNPEKLEKFLVEKMKSLGTAACPPYHIAFVIGGTSADACMKTVKLATAKELDGLPTDGNEHGRAFRDVALEAEAPRGGPASSASAPSSAASTSPTTCGSSACRATAPPAPSAWRFPAPPTATSRRRSPATGSSSRRWTAIPAGSSPSSTAASTSHGVKIDLNRPMKEILAELSQHPVGDAAAPQRHHRRRPRHRPRQVQGDPGQRQAAARLPEETSRSTTPGRPRPPRASPPAPSAPPRPGAWTATSTCFSPTAAR